MPDQLITQCPKCSTSFRINDAQLAAAKGAVRCGACLTVFSALDNLVSDSEPPSIAKVKQGSTSSKNAESNNAPISSWPQDNANDIAEGTPAAETSLDENTAPEETGSVVNETANSDPIPEDSDALAYEEPTPDDEGLFDSEEVLSADIPAEETTKLADISEASPNEEAGLFDSEEVLSADTPAEETTDIISFDNSITSEPSDSNEEQSASSKESDQQDQSEISNTGSSSDAFSHETDDTEHKTEEDLDIFQDSPEELSLSANHQDNNNTEDSESFLEDDLSDTFLNINTKEKTEFFTDDADKTSVTHITSNTDESWTEALLDDDEPEYQQKSNDELELSPKTTIDKEQPEEALSNQSIEEPLVASREPAVQDILSNLEASPVEFHTTPISSRPWAKIASYTLGLALCSILLLAEYAWYDFYKLSSNPSLRPWYGLACKALDCELPALIDVKKIKSANLVIRSHPKNKKALVVDAIITNKAAFKQPFPLLELTFSDFSDQVIASRRFKPYEYLGGELAGAKVMPAQTPIHIALEIIDPGKSAVNYQVKFYPSTQQ